MARCKRREYILIIIFSILFGSVYLWFVSIGTWTKLSQTSTYYYRMMADGFLARSASLLIEPDPRLAILENPYPAENREDIPILMDAAYYHGKYYLYYGPVPAFFLSGIMFLTRKSVSDGYFTFFSAWIIFISSAIIITRIWHFHFKRIPIWMVALSLIIAGTLYPLLWATNSARIYEAATTTSTAFLLMGIIAAFGVLDGKPPKRFSLFIAGLLWGLALGSRLLSIIPISVLCGAIIIRLFFMNHRLIVTRHKVIDMLSVLAPLGLTLFFLGWYNYIRFENPFETGMRYSLIGLRGVSPFYYEGHFFNFRYFLPNLINYLINPLEYSETFPFVKIIQGNGLIYEFMMNSEYGYVREGVAGLLISTPFIIFLGVFIWCAIKKLVIRSFNVNAELLTTGVDRPSDLIFLISAIGIAAGLSFFILLNYYVVTTRFILDFFPLLMLVIIAGMWLLYYYVTDSRPLRFLFNFVVLLMAVYSVGISFLLAITGELNRFQNFNPDLFEKISMFFS